MKIYLNLTLLLTITLFTLASCKKDKPDPAEEPPIEEETNATISLLYKNTATVSLKRERVESTTDGDFFYASGGQNPGELNELLYTYNYKSKAWKTIPLSVPRNESKIISLKGRVFVVGGWHRTREALRIDIYDQATGQSTVKLLGDQVFGSGSAVNVAKVNDRYLVLLNYNYFHIYDSEGDNWQSINMAAENHIFPTSVATIGTKIYILDHLTPKVLWVYDFNSGAFAKIDVRTSDGNTKILAKDDTIYFYSNSLAGRSDKIDRLHISDNTWDQIQLPHKMDFYNLNIDEKGKNLIVSGGRVESQDGMQVSTSADLFVYNIVGKSWANFKLKKPRIFHTCEILQDEFIVFGGLSGLYIENSEEHESEIYAITYSN